MKKVLWSVTAAGFVIVVAILSLGGYLYSRDATALREFDAAYRAYDKAVTAAELDKTSAAEQGAERALGVLKERSRVRISSVLKNGALLNNQTQWIAGLAGQELDALRTEDTKLAEWTRRRRAAYAQFRAYTE